jgi:hypothetical protein
MDTRVLADLSERVRTAGSTAASAVASPVASDDEAEVPAGGEVTGSGAPAAGVEGEPEPVLAGAVAAAVAVTELPRVVTFEELYADARESDQDAMARRAAQRRERW